MEMCARCNQCEKLYPKSNWNLISRSGRRNKLGRWIGIKMTREREWVNGFIQKLDKELKKTSQKGLVMAAADGTKLAYACEIQSYGVDGQPIVTTNKYETDILISDVFDDGRWIPRVIVECKLESVTTHDALTYSAKASSHRAVHPYLRYGLLAGRLADYALPARLIRHGQQFDFMISWKEIKASAAEWKSFCSVILQEVEASRKLQLLLTDNRSANRVKHSNIHKPINFVQARKTK